jgi:hypothetical protein
MSYATLVERADRKARQASDLLYDMANRVSPLTPGDDATEYARATEQIERTFARVLEMRNEALADYRAADYAYEQEFQ